MTIEEKIWINLCSRGLTKIAVAGIMGNLQAESNLKSNNLEDTRNRTFGMSDELYTSSVDSGTYSKTKFVNDKAGYGLAQWTTKDRKEYLYNICKGAGKSISDLNCQLDVLYRELINMGLLNDMNNARTVDDASTIFLKRFEIPLDSGEKVQNYRASLSQGFYDKLKNIEIGGISVMKYSTSNPPLKCIMTNSTCFKQTRKMDIKGVLVHSTGANNPTLKRYVQPSTSDTNYQKLMNLIGKNLNGNDWNHINIQAGLNAWIGELADGTVTSVQTMPWDYRPWGCGSGSAGSCNDGWIQYEICEDALTDQSYFNLVYKEACELTAYLCKIYKLNPKGTINFQGKNVPVILCHQDSYRLGLGSNHSDTYHWFGRFGKDMNTFRNDVAQLMSGISDDTNDTPITPSTSTDELAYTRLLKRGRYGDDVKALQEALVKLGYSVGTYGADGDYGQATEAAVRQFQQDNDLDVDGEAGPNTINMINKKLAEKNGTPSVDPTPIPTPTPTPTPITPDTPEQPIQPVTGLYRVRKVWANTESQVGAFRDLEKAKQMCDAAGPGYFVFDAAGNKVYAAKASSDEPSGPVTPAKTYSDVMIGSASKDERGQYVGGQAGDQTGKEVWVLNWYDQNWTSILRPKNPALAEKIARQCENACANKNIGYSQSERNTLLTAAKKVNYDMAKINTPCNCDCSSFVSAICVCCGLPESIFFAGGNGRVTSNMSQACLQTGKFTEYTDMKYRNQKNYLKRGDILLNKNQHVVIVLQDGKNA